MSDDPRTERLVGEWLDDLRHPRPPDYVVDAVLSSIPSTRQDSADSWTVAVPAVRAPWPRRGRRDRGGRCRADGAGPSRVSPPARCNALPHANANAPVERSVAAARRHGDRHGARDLVAYRRRRVRLGPGRGQRASVGSIGRPTPWASRVPREIPHMQLKDGHLWALDAGRGIVRLDPLTGPSPRSSQGSAAATSRSMARPRGSRTPGTQSTGSISRPARSSPRSTFRPDPRR